MLQPGFRRTLTSLAAGLACSALSFTALAQQPPAPAAAAASAPASAAAPEAEQAAGQAPEARVVVTGFRASLLKAVDLKREAIGARDSIVAEDIGKFPEQNIADALVRLPGVEVTKDPASGEGQRVQLRGLGSQYTVTTFNGAPVRTTSSGNIGTATRDFNYDVFASELFGRVDVYKSPLAELEEGGVAGVVDLRSPRPFDSKGQVFRYSLAAAYNDLSRQTSPRGHVLFSKTWDNIGVLVSVATSRARNATTGFETTGGYNSFNQRNIPNGSFLYGWNTTGTPPINLNGATVAQLNDALMPRFIRATNRQNERERTGFNTSLQYKTDRLDLSWDTLYSNLDDDTRVAALNFPVRRVALSNTAFGGPFTAANSLLVPVNVRIDANNNVQGTVGNLPMSSNGVSNIGETRFEYNALNGRYKVNDRLALAGQVTVSRSEAERNDATTTAQDESLAGRHTVTFDLSDPFAPKLSTNRDLLDPLAYTTFLYTGSYRTETDKQKTAKVVAEYDYSFLGIDSKLKAGVGTVQSTKIVNNFSAPNLFNTLVLPGGGTFATATDAQRQAFIRPFLQPNELGDLAARSGGSYPTNWLTLNRDFVTSTLDARNQNKNAPRSLGSSFIAEETINSFFVQSDFETEVLGRVLRANAGVRYLQTKTDVDNFVRRGTATNFEPNNRSDSYENVLPSVSLAYDLRQDLVWRASFGQTLTRSSISTIARSFDVPNTGNLVVTAGNPELKPERSNSTDTSLEWYFNRGSVLALAGFQKDIKDRAVTSSTFVPFNQLGLPATLWATNIQALLASSPAELVEVRTFSNAEAYKVSGVELSYQQQFSFLPAPFNGLGAIASFTRIKTAGFTRTYNSNIYELPIVPERTYALTGYYESGPLALRVSYNHKSEYANVTSDLSSLGFQRWFNARGFLDASVSYKFSKNFELRLDVANIGKTKTYDFFRQFEGLYGDEKSRIENGFQGGRTYTLGVRGSF